MNKGTCRAVAVPQVGTEVQVGGAESASGRKDVSEHETLEVLDYIETSCEMHSLEVNSELLR